MPDSCFRTVEGYCGFVLTCSSTRQRTTYVRQVLLCWLFSAPALPMLVKFFDAKISTSWWRLEIGDCLDIGRAPRDPPKNKEQTALSPCRRAVYMQRLRSPLTDKKARGGVPQAARSAEYVASLSRPLFHVLPCVDSGSASHGKAAREPAPPVDGTILLTLTFAGVSSRYGTSHHVLLRILGKTRQFHNVNISSCITICALLANKAITSCTHY